MMANEMGKRAETEGNNHKDVLEKMMKMEKFLKEMQDKVARYV